LWLPSESLAKTQTPPDSNSLGFAILH
jgi:hypothetical protein